MNEFASAIGNIMKLPLPFLVGALYIAGPIALVAVCGWACYKVAVWLYRFLFGTGRSAY